MALALVIVFLSHHNSVWNFRLDHMRVSFIRLLQGFRVFTFYHFCSQVVPICFVVISLIRSNVIGFLRRFHSQINVSLLETALPC